MVWNKQLLVGNFFHWPASDECLQLTSYRHITRLLHGTFWWSPWTLDKQKIIKSDNSRKFCLKLWFNAFLGWARSPKSLLRSEITSLDENSMNTWSQRKTHWRLCLRIRRTLLLIFHYNKSWRAVLLLVYVGRNSPSSQTLALISPHIPHEEGSKQPSPSDRKHMCTVEI